MDAPHGCTSQQHDAKMQPTQHTKHLTCPITPSVITRLRSPAGLMPFPQVLRQLSHDNIISYEDHFFDDEGSLCIVTCLCEEGELATRISERRKAGQLFTEGEVMDMFIQVGGGSSSSDALWRTV